MLAGVVAFGCAAALLATWRLVDWLTLESSVDAGVGHLAGRWQERRWAALARRRKE